MLGLAGLFILMWRSQGNTLNQMRDSERRLIDRISAQDTKRAEGEKAALAALHEVERRLGDKVEEATNKINAPGTETPGSRQRSLTSICPAPPGHGNP